MGGRLGNVRRLVLISGIVVLVPISPACSSFGSNPSGTNVATDGGGEGSSDTGGPPPAPPPPGPPTPPASGDAATEADGEAAAPFCTGTHYLCDDFERTAVLSTPWESLDLAGGGSAKIDNGAFESISPDDAHSRLLKPGNAMGTSLQCQMKLRVKASASVETTVATVKIVAGQAALTVQLRLRPDLKFSAELEGTSAAGSSITPLESTSAAPGMAIGQWTTATLGIVRGMSASAGVTIDGVGVSVDPTVAKSVPSFTQVEASIGILGLSGSSTPGSWDVEYDDVFCDVL